MKRLPIGLLALLLVVAAGLVAQDVTVIKVKVQSANVRSEPDMNAAVVRQVKLGTLLESRRAVGEWFEVTITDERGNAMSGFINISVVDVVGGGAKPGGQVGGQQVEVKKPAEGAPTIIVQQQVQQAQANTQTNVQTQNQAGETGIGGGAGGGFKIMGGLGLANMTMNAQDAQAQEYFDKYRQGRMGYAGGIGLAMGSRIGFEFDLLYLQKGVKFKGTYEDADVGKVTFDADLVVPMISLPVLLRFNILNSPSAPALYALGGAEIAYILDDVKATYSFTQAGQPNQKGTEKVDKKNRNEIDYGAVFGGGIGLNIGGIQVFLEGRYHIGMANIMKNADGTEAEGVENPKPKTSLILLMAGFKF